MILYFQLKKNVKNKSWRLTKKSTSELKQYADNLKQRIEDFYKITPEERDEDPEKYAEITEETEYEIVDYNTILQELVKRGIRTKRKPIPSIRSTYIAGLKDHASELEKHIKAFYELPPEEITEEPELYEKFKEQIELEKEDYSNIMQELAKKMEKYHYQRKNSQ